MYNEIEGNFDGVAIGTFKSGLPTEHGLRKSLTGKPVTSLRQLMDRINKYKRVEEDQQLGKGKAMIVSQERRDFSSDQFNNNNRPRRDFAGQSGSAEAQAVNAVFRDLVHQVLEKIKNESFFKWPNKMVNLESQRDTSLRPPIGTINVILAAPGKTGSYPSRVMSVTQLSTEDDNRESKKAKKEAPPVLGFSNEDKIETIQPHDDALVVTLRIGGYDVKRVLVDQGSAMEVMYPNLYKGLNLKPEDLTAYDFPLVSFEGKTVTLRGQIRLPIQTGSDVVEADFIVIDAYSPYTTIVARPWLHALGAVFSTLHQKVKYPLEGQVKEIVGNQSMAR
ncbi:uncharacterized protein LOC126691364 [Quercus robur]|uniref:uncharacterized protein LOC126691364 n=1 Tax=Quercus robur TaxID=38942 RepID=UPI0021637887|nr:uncharacterized protein LOC126691364 [Quercus robur]